MLFFIFKCIQAFDDERMRQLSCYFLLVLLLLLILVFLFLLLGLLDNLDRDFLLVRLPCGLVYDRVTCSASSNLTFIGLIHVICTILFVTHLYI